MRIAVIGGGPSGVMAAGTAAENREVVLFEKNGKILKKLYITGKGRCNITNASGGAEFLSNVVRGGKFLFSALRGFSPDDTVEFFREYGVKLKVERGNRVFPESDKSSDIIKGFERFLRDRGVEIWLNCEVSEIRKTEDGKFEITFKNGGGNGGKSLEIGGERLIKNSEISGGNGGGKKGKNSEFGSINCGGERGKGLENGGIEPRFKEVFDRVVVATGGLSYPSTGSDGAGYKFAEIFGHKIVPLCPALTSIKVFEDIKALEGLSLKNVKATAYYAENLREIYSEKSGAAGRLGSFKEVFSEKDDIAKAYNAENLREIYSEKSGAAGRSEGLKEVFSEFGEMLFAGDALSGPLILSMSSKINRLDLKSVQISVDLKPSLTEDVLDARILRDFKELANKNFSNALDGLLPKSLIPYIIRVTGISPFLKVNELERERRKALVRTLKGLVFSPVRLGEIEAAIVTSGGIELSEINPKTMESKLVKNLFFVGETLDADALTGGFNLQIATATGYACGKACGA
jgi:predicted flavoprotein YhiN